MENAPDVVKICHESLLRNYDANTQEIICLDKTNIFEYVSLPDYIMKKFEDGIISITHLSDIIRTQLLYQTGGMWTDATMYFTKPIDNQIFERDFFTLKNPMADVNRITSKWECFFIAGKKDFPLFGLLKDMWFEYWKKEDILIEYLLIDHVFYIGYRENSRIRQALDSCPGFYYRINYLQRMINEEYSDGRFKEICSNEPYIKLTYKGQLEKCTRDGKLTYYGKMCQEYIG